MVWFVSLVSDWKELDNIERLAMFMMSLCELVLEFLVVFIILIALTGCENTHVEDSAPQAEYKRFEVLMSQGMWRNGIGVKIVEDKISGRQYIVWQNISNGIFVTEMGKVPSTPKIGVSP